MKTFAHIFKYVYYVPNESCPNQQIRPYPEPLALIQKKPNLGFMGCNSSSCPKDAHPRKESCNTQVEILITKQNSAIIISAITKASKVHESSNVNMYMMFDA